MDLIDSLFERLVEALEREGTPSGRLTVGDVYRRLVPYRTVRYEIGVLELAQYEDALLRLLAGERGYLEVQDGGAATEFRRELSSLNPILGIYRDYAEAPLEILGRGPAAVSFAESLDATQEAPQPGDLHLDRTAEALPPLRPHRQEPPSPAGSRPTSPVRHPPGTAPTAGDLSAAPASCRRCGESLPPEEDLRFCPACGEDQQPISCARCEAPLRQEWNFCIRCGTRRGEGAPAS